MTIDELERRTRRILAARQRRVVPDGSLIRAAVLIPILDRGEPAILFVKRTETVAHHKGQIAFPGGVVDPDDPSALDAALREAEEEVGLPRRAVEVLGILDDSETVATPFVITPFVGLVREAVDWKPDGVEIDRVLEVPYAALAADGSFRVEYRERGGVVRPVHFFDYRGDTIWGATARILTDYLALVGDVERQGHQR